MQQQVPPFLWQNKAAVKFAAVSSPRTRLPGLLFLCFFSCFCLPVSELPGSLAVSTGNVLFPPGEQRRFLVSARSCSEPGMNPPGPAVAVLWHFNNIAHPEKKVLYEVQKQPPPSPFWNTVTVLTLPRVLGTLTQCGYFRGPKCLIHPPSSHGRFQSTGRHFGRAPRVQEK